MECVHYPEVPQRVPQKALKIQFNFNRIKSATKFLCMKTSNSSCSTTIPISNSPQKLVQTLTLQPKI